MFRLTKLHLRTRLILLTLPGMVVIFILMAWQGIQAMNEVIQMILKERLTLAQTVALHLDQELERRLESLEQVAALPAMTPVDGVQQPGQRELRALYDSQLFTYVLLLDKDGLVLYSEPHLPRVVGVMHLESPHILETLRSGQPNIAIVDNGLTPGSPVVVAVAAVRNRQGAIVGALGGAIDTSSQTFSHRLQRVLPTKTGYIQLVDEGGRVLTHTEGRGLFQKSEHADFFVSLLKEKKSAIATQAVTERGKGTFREVIAFAPLNNAAWGVAVEQAEAELLAPVLELRQRKLLFAGAILTGALLLILVTTRSVLQPVCKLVAASRRIASGDLLTTIPSMGEDEIGELGRSFEVMRQRLAHWGEELDAAVQRRTRHLSILYNIDRATAQSLELDVVLKDSVAAIMETMQIEAGGIYLLEADGRTLTLRVHQGVSEDFVEAVQHIRLGEGISGQAAAERKPVVLDVPDYSSERLASFITQAGFQTLASTPLLSGGKLVGVLNLATQQSRAFPLEEIDLLTAIGQQLGTAVQNAQSYQKEQRMATQLHHLNQAMARVNASLELDAMARVVTQTLVDDLNIAFARLWVVDEAGENLVLKASAGIYTRLDGKRSLVSIATDPYKLGVIARERQPLITNTVQQDSHFDKVWAEKEGLVAFAGYSLVLQDRLLGVLALFSRQPLSDHILEFLGLFVNQLVVAIENSRLYHETQRNLAELEARHRLITATLGTPNLGERLCIALDETRQLLRAEMGGVYLVERDRLILRAQQGLPDDLLASIWDLPLAESPWAAETTVCRGLLSEQGGQVDVVYKRAGVQSCVTTPLMVEGRLIGVICLASHRYEAFSPNEVRALSALGDQLSMAVENARLYTQGQQRLVRLNTLREIDRAIGAQLSLEELMSVILEHVHPHIVDVDALGFSLIDWEKKQTLLARLHLPGNLYIEGEAIRLSDSLLECLSVRQEPVLIYDLLADPRIQNHRHLVQQYGLQTYLGVPLVVQNQCIGVLHVLTTQPRHFRDEELGFFVTLAGQAAISLQNARFFQEKTQQLAELSAVFEVSVALRGAATVDEMLPIILNTTVKVCNSNAGAILLCDPATNDIVVRAAHRQMEHLLGKHFKVNDKILSHVLSSHQPYIIPFMKTDPLIPSALREQLHDIASAIVLPLEVGSTSVGMMSIAYMSPHTFSESEIHILSSIANMAASAVHRASLFEALQARLREMATVYQVVGTITTTLEIEEVLDFIVRAASETLDAEASYLFLWDDRQERLVLQAAQGFSLEIKGQVKYRLGEGLIGWVFLEEKSANVADLAADPRWKREPSFEKALLSGQAQNTLVVPLAVGTKMLGVLGVVNKIGDHAFNEGNLSLLTALAGQMAIAIENARLYKDVRDLSVATIRSLATAIDARDPYTKGHSEQVANLCVIIARVMGWDHAELEMLEFAALLHDIGKVAVPDAILLKTELLTPDDWNTIMLHPYYSAQIVKPVEPLHKIVLWIYHHHESWDGTGYPDGLKGEAIPLAARIIAVVDTYNAITTDRPYRPAKTPDEAIEELEQCAGAQFDPQVVQRFVQLLREQPSTILARKTSGRTLQAGS